MYGILTERSDLRVHVCPRERTVYVFPTASGVAAVQSGRYRALPAYQKGVKGPTAVGYSVPPEEIEGCLALSPRRVAWEAMDFRDFDPPGEKGRKAVRFVMQMIERGMFPMPLIGKEIPQGHALQVQGTDIVIEERRVPQRRIEVKCDYKGGRRGLYLQVAERNPRGIH